MHGCTRFGLFLLLFDSIRDYWNRLMWLVCSFYLLNVPMACSLVQTIRVINRWQISLGVFGHSLFDCFQSIFSQTLSKVLLCSELDLSHQWLSLHQTLSIKAKSISYYGFIWVYYLCSPWSLIYRYQPGLWGVLYLSILVLKPRGTGWCVDLGKIENGVDELE